MVQIYSELFVDSFIKKQNDCSSEIIEESKIVKHLKFISSHSKDKSGVGMIDTKELTY